MRFSFSATRFSCFFPPTSRFDATRLGRGLVEENYAQSKLQIHNLPVAMRIIIEYQKLCYSLFHSARLLPACPFREDAQYKSPGHYANPPNDIVPTSTLRRIHRERFGSPPTDDTCTNFRLGSFRIPATALPFRNSNPAFISWYCALRAWNHREPERCTRKAFYTCDYMDFNGA